MLWALLLAAAVPAPTVVVDGTATDALLVRGGEVWISASGPGGRRLVRVNAKGAAAAPPIAVPAGAIFADSCGKDGVVFADAAGLVDVNGKRLADGRALFTVPDPDALYVADLCGRDGDGKGELRLPVVDGLLVLRPDGTGRTLSLRHEARAYSGRVHRGLRPDRGYAEALSLYGPRLFDVDVDGDGDTDLVAVREGRITAWKRERGVLAASPSVDRDWSSAFGADADLRIRLLDVDGDHRADAVVGVTRGAVPERSEAWLLSSTKDAPFSEKRRLWSRDGLVAPIGDRGRDLVIAEIDTSLVSLSAVVLTGNIPVKVSVAGSEPLRMQAKVDVRAGRMDGAMPVVSVDFDGDGIPDLLDLGEPGRAVLHRGRAERRGGAFDLDAAAEWQVPAFVHVVPMPALPGVVLVGAPAHGKTSVAILTRPSPR